MAEATWVRIGPFHGRPVAIRFWEKVSFGPTCWEWQATRGHHGYGAFKAGAGMVRATHYAMEWDGRKLAPGQQALHSCDNPPCVNPAHLFAGNPKVNAEDRLAKGRQHDMAGEKHPSHRLTNQQVDALREEYAYSGSASAVLAARYGISRTHLYEIVRGESWGRAPVQRIVPAPPIRYAACRRGHRFTPENTYIRPNGTQLCRECSRASDRRRAARVLEAQSTA